MDKLPTLGFIGVVAVIALIVGTRTTRISGTVMAERLREKLVEQDPAIERVVCDDDIPIDRRGARFRCTIHAPGDAIEVHYEMDRDGALRALPRRRP